MTAGVFERDQWPEQRRGWLLSLWGVPPCFTAVYRQCCMSPAYYLVCSYPCCCVKLSHQPMTGQGAALHLEKGSLMLQRACAVSFIKKKKPINSSYILTPNFFWLGFLSLVLNLSVTFCFVCGVLRLRQVNKSVCLSNEGMQYLRFLVSPSSTIL